jgi:hypothetical protein
MVPLFVLVPSRNRSPLSLSGVDLPWDNNKFFFEISQNGYPGTVDKLDIFTTTHIYYDNENDVCGEFAFDYFYFVPEEKLNLYQATVNRASIAGEPGYTVIGDNQCVKK